MLNFEISVDVESTYELISNFVITPAVPKVAVNST